MSKKRLIITAVIFLVLAGLTYGVFANSHIDIFPGVEKEYDYIMEMEVMDKGLISLRDHNYPDESQFTAMGYVVAFLTIILIPGALAYKIGERVK